MPSHSLFEVTKHGSLGNQIFNILRDRILNEEYNHGDKLNELTLAKEFNISRTPVRESLKQLELEGLVESIPNKGVFVKGFKPRDIDDMFEVRKILESLAVGLAIDRINDIYLAKIKDVYDLMEFYTKKKDNEKIHDLNILYHEMIYQATQSSYLMQVLKDIHYYVSVTTRHSLKQHQRMETSLKEHKAILDAIMDRDKDLAKSLIVSHINKSQMLVRKYYALKEKKR